MKPKIYITALAIAVVSVLFMWGCGGQVFENPPEKEAVLGSVPVNVGLIAGSDTRMTGVNKDKGDAFYLETGGEGRERRDGERSTCAITVSAKTEPGDLVDLMRDPEWHYVKDEFDVVEAPNPDFCSANPDSCIVYGIDVAGGTCYLWMVGYVSNIAAAESIDADVTFNADYTLAATAAVDQGFRLDLHMTNIKAQTSPDGELADILGVSTFINDTDLTNLNIDASGCDGNPAPTEATVSFVDWAVGGDADFVDPPLSDPLDGRKNLTVTAVGTTSSACLIKTQLFLDIPLFEAVDAGVQLLTYGPIMANIMYCTQKSVTCPEFGADRTLSAPTHMTMDDIEIDKGSTVRTDPSFAKLVFAEEMDASTISVNTVYARIGVCDLPYGLESEPSQSITEIEGSGGMEYAIEFGEHRTLAPEDISSYIAGLPLQVVVQGDVAAKSGKTLEQADIFNLTAQYSVSSTFMSDSASGWAPTGWLPEESAWSFQAVDFANWAAAREAGYVTWKNTEAQPSELQLTDAGLNEQKMIQGYKELSGVYTAGTDVVTVILDIKGATGFDDYTDANNMDSDVVGLLITDKAGGNPTRDDFLLIAVATMNSTGEDDGPGVRKCVALYFDNSAADFTAGNSGACPAGAALQLKMAYNFRLPAAPVLTLQWYDAAGGWQDISDDYFTNDEILMTALPDITAADVTWLDDNDAKRLSIMMNSANVVGNNDDIAVLRFLDVTNFTHATYSYVTQDLVP